MSAQRKSPIWSRTSKTPSFVQGELPSEARKVLTTRRSMKKKWQIVQEGIKSGHLSETCQLDFSCHGSSGFRPLLSGVSSARHWVVAGVRASDFRSFSVAIVASLCCYAWELLIPMRRRAGQPIPKSEPSPAFAFRRHSGHTNTRTIRIVRTKRSEH